MCSDGKKSWLKSVETDSALFEKKGSFFATGLESDILLQIWAFL